MQNSDIIDIEEKFKILQELRQILQTGQRNKINLSCRNISMRDCEKLCNSAIKSLPFKLGVETEDIDSHKKINLRLQEYAK